MGYIILPQICEVKYHIVVTETISEVSLQQVFNTEIIVNANSFTDLLCCVFIVHLQI